MAIRLVLSRCPNCGAPLDVAETRSIAICIFCNRSLRVERQETQALPATLGVGEVPPEEIEGLKQLVVDGQREQAIARYAQLARVPLAEAESAVDGMGLEGYWELVRNLPMNPIGFAMILALALLGAGVAGLAASQVGASPGLWAVVVLGALFALWQLKRFVRHLRATLVASFGAVGRGRVLECTTVRAVPEREAFIVAVVFEVTPDAGGPPFVDQEMLFVGAETRAKLAVGNRLRVRFAREAALVFPETPVTLLR
jgi:hypothetical protein